MNMLCLMVGLAMGFAIGYLVAVEMQEAQLNKACKEAYKKGRTKERRKAFTENIKLHKQLEKLEGDNEFLRNKLNIKELMLDE